jgi:hypothetical protein
MNDRLGATGTAQIVITGGDGNDELGVPSTPPAGGFFTQVSGDAGNDRITTGDGDDVAVGGLGTDSIATGGGEDLAIPGPGDGESVDAGPGNDAVSAQADQGVGDRYEGGPGIDELATGAPDEPPADLALDLAAGTVGGTNVAAATATGFEDVSALGHTTTTIRGTPGGNSIETRDGADTVDPGAGSDLLNLGGGADRALVRDGSPDSVRCGPGQDSAEVDQLDTTAACEDVASAFVRPAAAGGAPGCALAVRQRIARTALIRRGLRAAVECDTPAELEVRLLGRATRDGEIGAARAGDVVLAERSLPLAGGRRTVRMRVVRRLRKAVARRARLRLEVVARDEFGNVQVLTTRLRVTSPRVRAR